MRTATVVSALIGFLPLTWLSLVYGWGLAGIWSGLATFVALRLLFVGWRTISGRWALTGRPDAPKLPSWLSSGSRAAISTSTGRYTAPVTPLLPDARRARHRPWRDYALFVVLVGPNVGLLLLFIYRPLADNIRLSFFDWNVSDPKADYVGFSNYAEWFARDDTRQIVLNTAVFTTAAVVGSMVLGWCWPCCSINRCGPEIWCARWYSRPS
ncbi:SN-glycerol-3-phosphate transport integral membrane ABC transporter UgpA domain protein [Mycobacterium kansasii]|uniref:SN-glycerol-3-phosphate transport integral membrane ABC transporter UgpA domain protein n=1 Tax=Mycobacterium kansasii TaxID=1768 RepID=A0A1V3XZH5_MYCKA|nr:SN-glycerol-3-phosphate transport integral membrane ABC transporter UgpA domain protein [Mycobacterium kansasii]